ncbi:MAG: PilZ domain-containing protein [Candidatus Omnitrophota bacterium]
MKDKRQYPRIIKSVSLKLSDVDFDVVTETKNISGNGVYCAVSKPFEAMTKLAIIILIPLANARGRSTVKKIRCQGVVVRTEHVRDNGKYAYHVGIYFNDIKESDRKALVSYINSHVHHRSVFPTANA